MLTKQIAILKPQWIEILTGTNIKQCFLFIHPVWPATPPGLSCHLKHEQYWHCQSIFPWKYHTGEMHIPCTWRQKYCLPATHHLHKLWLYAWYPTGPFYLRRLTLIPPHISNYIHYKFGMKLLIIPQLQGLSLGILEIEKYFSPIVY